MSIRVMIADDEPVSRAGILRMLEGSEVEVVCVAGQVDETVRFAMTTRPDILLLDVHMPAEDGFVALRQLQQDCPAVRVLMFSATDDLQELTQARALGAAGYLTKDVSREELLRVLRRVAEGKKAWTRAQIRRVSSRFAQRAVREEDFAPLSKRQREVLARIAKGMPNEEIAEELGVDIETVKQHVKQILHKLHVEDRTQAAIWAMRRHSGGTEPPSS